MICFSKFYHIFKGLPKKWMIIFIWILNKLDMFSKKGFKLLYLPRTKDT